MAAATGLRAPTPGPGPGDRPPGLGVGQRRLHPAAARPDPARRSRTAGAAHRPLSVAGVPGPAPGPLAGLGRSAGGAQIGLVLAWMSTRVLGQYDLLLTDELVDDQDLVYYVGPNVVALESRYGFPPRQFRLWLALHEVTHRCQFTAVPWLRDHFVSLVDQGLEPMVADPAPAGRGAAPGRRRGAGRSQPAGRRRHAGAGGHPRAARGAPAHPGPHEPAWRATAT